MQNAQLSSTFTKFNDYFNSEQEIRDVSSGKWTRFRQFLSISFINYRAFVKL
jgi:hypothetical protein